jgi:FkbM family methyltransferase
MGRAAVKEALKRTLGRFGFELRRLSAHHGVPHIEEIGLAHVLEILFRSVDDLTFVQVGANDGVLNDLLHPFLESSNPRGILIEPQAMPFRKLQARYGNRPELSLLQAAVDKQAGSRILYHCRDDLLPSDAGALLSGLASFDRSQVVKAYRRQARRLGLTDHPDTAVVGDTVVTLTLDTVLNRSGYDRCDLLVIDTEGHDFEIIKSIDFSKMRPSVLIYEHIHLCRADRLACWDLLQTCGYRCAAGWSDTLALLDGEPASAAGASNRASTMPLANSTVGCTARATFSHPFI